jgi:hypothetical protein
LFLLIELTEAVSNDGLLVDGLFFKYSLVFELLDDIDVFNLLAYCFYPESCSYFLGTIGLLSILT